MYRFFKVCATPTLNVIIFTFGVAAAPPNVIIITLSTLVTLGVATKVPPAWAGVTGEITEKRW
jgi:hypothetical protein